MIIKSIDSDTKKAVPKKVGRPLTDPEHGPMSEVERQRKLLAGRTALRLFLTETMADKLRTFCKRHGISRHDLISGMINNLNMDRIPKGIKKTGSKKGSKK
ncbi:MAG: RepB family protein [Sedimenticola sp.]